MKTGWTALGVAGPNSPTNASNSARTPLTGKPFARKQPSWDSGSLPVLPSIRVRVRGAGSRNVVGRLNLGSARLGKVAPRLQNFVCQVHIDVASTRDRLVDRSTAKVDKSDG